jgi:hypothetical protein
MKTNIYNAARDRPEIFMQENKEKVFFMEKSNLSTLIVFFRQKKIQFARKNVKTKLSENGNMNILSFQKIANNYK